MTGLKLYTSKEVAEKLHIELSSLYNYLRDCGYWRFNKRYECFMPYAKYCKPRKKKRKTEEEYFALRQEERNGVSVEVGMITEKGLNMLICENIPKHYI